MYARYAETLGWRVEVLSSNETGVGAIKEVVVLIEGKRVYSQLKYESGVHRVQRIPVTESGGRVHTSAATVAILPEAEDVDYILELIKTDMEETGDEDVFRKVKKDFENSAISMDDSEIRNQMSLALERAEKDFK